MLHIHRWAEWYRWASDHRVWIYSLFSMKSKLTKVNIVFAFGKKCFLPHGMCFQMDIVCAFRVLWSHPPWTTPCQCSQQTSWVPWRSRWTIFHWGQQERWVEESDFVSWALRRCRVLFSLALLTHLSGSSMNKLTCKFNLREHSMEKDDGPVASPLVRLQVLLIKWHSAPDTPT